MYSRISPVAGFYHLMTIYGGIWYRISPPSKSNRLLTWRCMGILLIHVTRWTPTFLKDQAAKRHIHPMLPNSKHKPTTSISYLSTCLRSLCLRSKERKSLPGRRKTSKPKSSNLCQSISINNLLILRHFPCLLRHYHQ